MNMISNAAIEAMLHEGFGFNPYLKYTQVPTIASGIRRR
jgi:hypothetical protein